MKFNLSIISKHITFWLVYLLLWSLHDLSYNSALLENLRTNSIPFLFYASLVYINLYVLIPRFLLKKSIASYILFLILGIGILTVFTSHYFSFYFTDINSSTSDFFGSLRGIISIITEVIISLCLSMTLFLIDEWYKKEQRIIDLQKNPFEPESGQIGNQINPHVLFNSLNSIYVMLNQQADTEDSHSHIFIKSNGMVIKVFVDDITFVETASDYVYINTVNKDRYLTLVSLKQLEGALPTEKFIRVHRYYLVGIDHVEKLEGNLIHIDKTKIKISRALRNEVYKAIIGNKLIERY